MDLEEAQRLIGGGEGQRVEFKTGFAEENAAIEALGAFANALGGVVFFGVTRDSVPCGATIGTNTIENFVNKLRRESQPPLSPRIDSLDIDGKVVVTASVATPEPGQLFHVFNKALVRVGCTNQVMSPAEQRARLLKAQETLPKEQEPAVRISAATSYSGQEGFVWVYNPGVAEKFCVRVRGFEANNLGLELKATWSTGEEEGVIKKGDKDWCLVMKLEPDRVITRIARGGHLVIPIFQQDALRRQNERHQRGARLVRFVGQSYSRDIEVAQGVQYGLDVVVLSDTREPVTERIAYGVGGDRLVIPFDHEQIAPLVEEDQKRRSEVEELMKRLEGQSESAQ